MICARWASGQVMRDFPATSVDLGGTAVALAHVEADVKNVFADFYRDTYRDMVRLAVLMVGSVQAAEDIVQDSFVAVQRRWDRIDDPLRYTRRTVANRSKSHHRRRFLERRHETSIDEPTYELATSELTDVLATLPARQRQAVVLRFYEDLSQDETASVMGCRPGTVGSLVSRAMTSLRVALDEVEI